MRNELQFLEQRKEWALLNNIKERETGTNSKYLTMDEVLNNFFFRIKYITLYSSNQ